MISAVSAPEAHALQELARGHSVLEVGSAWGYSTIVMARVARLVVSVDPHQALGSLVDFRANLQAHGVASRVQVLVEDSRTALPSLLAAGRRFELVFIDGDHSEPAVRFDAMWARHLITPGGVVAFHDYHAEAGDPVTEALASWGPPDELTERLAVYRGGGPA